MSNKSELLAKINKNLSHIKYIQSFGINNINGNVEFLLFNGIDNIDRPDMLTLKGVFICMYQKIEEYIDEKSVTPYCLWNEK